MKRRNKVLENFGKMLILGIQVIQQMRKYLLQLLTRSTPPGQAIDINLSLGLMSTVSHRGTKDLFHRYPMASVVEICSSKIWKNMQPLPIASARLLNRSQLPRYPSLVSPELNGMVRREKGIGFLLRICGEDVAMIMGRATNRGYISLRYVPVRGLNPGKSYPVKREPEDAISGTDFEEKSGGVYRIFLSRLLGDGLYRTWFLEQHEYSVLRAAGGDTKTRSDMEVPSYAKLKINWKRRYPHLVG